MVVVGCNHSTAPESLLERVAVPPGELTGLLAGLRNAVREAFVVSTCNRTEIYAVTGHAASGAEILLGILADRAALDVGTLRPHAYVRCDAAAVSHAMRVASGLDSMVLGEDQVQSQWKRALAAAAGADLLGPVLDRLGAAALGCGKRVRTFTGIGRHAVSLESLAVRRAAAELGLADFAGRRALVIGAGESAALIVTHLQSSGASHITVMSRSFEKAEAFAAENGIEALPFDAIAGVVVESDAVFCCTAAPHPVLGHAHFGGWSARDPNRPLVCVDLGMPRDIEHAVSGVPGVRIMALAELAALAESHREERRTHVPAAEAIVAAETGRFLEWHSSRGCAATVTRLHAHGRNVATVELDAALARLPHLAPKDREVLTIMAHRIVSKLLHAPSVTLRNHPEAENIALALACAFGLPGAGQALHAAIPRPDVFDAPAAEPIQETA